MKKSAQLKQLRASKIEAQRALHAKAEAEKRNLTEEETSQFRTLQTEIEDLNGQITDAVAYEENLRSLEGGEGVDGEGKEGGEGQQRTPKKRAFSLNSAIRSMINGTALTGAELEAHERAMESARAAGIGIAPSSIAVPMFDSRSVNFQNRADGQTVNEDSGAYGGNAVATDVLAPIDYLRPQPVVEKLGAVFLTGLQGNIQFPKNNGGVTATWEGEVDEVANTKNAIGKIEMKPKRLAVSVLVSLQNLMQSSFDMEMYTMNEIRKAIENEIDKAAIAGASGGDSPVGVLNTSGVNSVAMGTNGAVPSFAKIVELETEVFVDNANGARMSYLSNAKVRGKAKTTVLESGQATYLLQNNEMNGYPFETSNHVPSNLTKGTASGVCSAIIFGDWSQLVVGQWGFMDISVDDKSRKKEGYVEITANVYLDVAVKQPTAFAVCKDLLTA
jgi:HK97 family phage major capsid protein